LDMIASQIHRIARVTKDLTEFSRVRPARMSVVDLGSVIDSALRLARFDEGFQRLRVSIVKDEGISEVEADPDQLQQVFLNLFLNARDAMPDGGEINIKIGEAADSAIVTVSDTGPGMDEAAAKRAFDPFFTTKPAGKGTGLGLPVCYAIVTAHGGTIEVGASQTGGAAISVSLPAK